MAALRRMSVYLVVVLSSLGVSSGSCRYGFGLTCAFPCRCANGNCNTDTGECLSGGECQRWRPGAVPWTGQGCRIELTAFVGNVAKDKSTSQSGIREGYGPDAAVDGAVGTSLVDGKCSYITQSQGSVWWMVDLGEMHVVSSVIIYGLQAKLDQYKILFGNSTVAESNPDCGTSGSGDNSQSDYTTVTCDQGKQFVGNKVFLKSYLIRDIILCELVVIGRRFIDCSLCPATSTCDNYQGCSQCPERFRVPDCKECSDGLVGENCCSPRCKDQACVKETGVCSNGCTYTLTGVWWIGDKCDEKLPVIQFGDMDNVDRTPVEVTTNSVTWRWKESTVLSQQAAPFVGYQIVYRQSAYTYWNLGVDIPYRQSEWQQGSVSQLQSDTEYEFNLKAYRKKDYRVHIGPSSYVDSLKPNGKPLRVRTLAIEKTTSERSITPTPLVSTNHKSSVQTKEPDSASTPLQTTTPSQQASPTTTTSVLKTEPESPTSPVYKNMTSGSHGPKIVTKPLAVGLIAGVTVGILLLLFIAGGIIFILVRRRKAPKDEVSDEEVTFPLEEQRPTTPKVNRDSASLEKRNPLVAIDDENEEIEEVNYGLVPDEAVYANARASVVLRSNIIRLEDLKSCIDKLNVGDGYKEEFNTIPSHEMLECVTASLAKNKLRNKFRNIKAYDSTRVVLEIKTKEVDSDYINANYITGYKEKKKAYVATQAPNKHTPAEFWTMIWQLKANRIVMLTRTFENGTRKCEQYWSETVENKKTFGKIVIETIKRDTFTDYVISLLNVNNGEESRTVRHLQYLSWPDKSAPDLAYQLLAFRRKVRSLDNVSRGPMIVHCSAGIGRTGTFIALDYLLQQAKAESQIDVVTLVNQMRTERMTMIQTLDQYKFVYTAVLEAVTIGDTAISTIDLQQRLTALTSVDKNGSYPLQNQFNVLDGLKQTELGEMNTRRKQQNIDKNRNVQIIPADRMMPKLVTSGDNDNTYINAVFVDNFRSEHGIIATQMPLSNTIEDFWRLVYQHRRTTIVMLNRLDKNTENCMVYWPDEEEPKQRYGDIEIKFLSSDSCGPILTRVFQIGKPEKRNGEIMMVKQFHLLDWPTDEELPNIGSLLDLIANVSASEKQEESVLVHCMDGASRSGLFCATCYMLDKIKSDQEVDVFLAVRCVSRGRPQFLNSMKQYRYLHEVAKEYISSFATYGNI